MTRRGFRPGILGSVAVISALVVPLAVGTGAHASSSLTRSDEPVVLTGDQVGPPLLDSVKPEDLVAFRHDGEWVQIPVQVDERHMMNLRDVYPTPFNCNPGAQCFTPGNRVLNTLVYSDPVTYSGADPDPVLDADDEVVFMVADAGGQAPTGSTDPAGVIAGSRVEISLTDALDGGQGHVYLFERDATGSTAPGKGKGKGKSGGAQGPGEALDPSAGQNYVTYRWDVLHIVDEASDYKNPQDHPTNPGYRFGGGYNPEDSWVETAHYKRGFTDRWWDHELRITRGDASGVDILDRHDASLTYDVPLGCIRDVNSFAQGEGAFVANIDGPVRAIRDYVGANSGPLVQRRHIFYEAKEVIDTFLRVHVIPGPTDFFDYNENAIGMEYRHWNELLPPVRIDGIPDVVPTHPAFPVRTRGWETVDSPPDSLLSLPGDPPAQGGLTFVHYLDTNNVDSTSRLIYRDNALGGPNYCNGQGTGPTSERAKLYGAHGFQTSPFMADTDAGSSTYLYYQRTIYFEEPGQTNGPLRMLHEDTPLTISASTP